jgi:hypothetical protein
MFTHEQSISGSTRIRTKKEVLRIGMAFVKPHSVKRQFTYKEFTLIVGILVALIIVFTLWVRQEPVKESPQTLKPKSISLPDAAKSLVKRAVAEIHF